MKWILKAGWWAGLAGIWLFSFAPRTDAAAPLALPFSNASAATNFNSLWQQITNAGFPTAYTCTQSNDYRKFRGAFSAHSAASLIGAHSDDGCRVTVSGMGGTAVLDFWGENTHLQNSSALRLLSYAFATGVEYCVEIEYTNHLHEANDLDGVTLYAYKGGGSVRDGIAVWGTDFMCKGGSTTLYACGDPIFTWYSSDSSIATVSGSGSSVTVQGVANGTTTINAIDANGKTGSRQVTVVKPGISPDYVVTCQGVTNALVVTNAQVTGGVTWTPGGNPSPDTRTNFYAFSTGGLKEITATWNGCSATAFVIVVKAGSLGASADNLCNAGQVTYTGATIPAGLESMLTWSGEGLTGSGASRTNTYSTPGIKTVTVSCGTSVVTNTVTVHKVDITNTTVYGLAGSPTPVTFGLSADSVGPFTWQASGGSSVSGSSGHSASVLPGSTPGAHTITAFATPLPECNDTSTLQVVQVTFSANPVAMCKGDTNSVSFTVNPPEALALLSFDTVTNTSFGPANTHATVTLNGTNLTVTGILEGTAYLRAKLGNTTLIGPTLQIVLVTFPAEAWYVGVGKSITNAVTIIPANASVAFDTVSSSIATASAVAGGVSVSGIGPGTTQIRAKVSSGAVCSTKDVTAVRVTFSTNKVILCTIHNRTVQAAVDPPDSPVVFTQSTAALQLSVQGTNVTVTPQTNVVATVTANVAGQPIAKFSVESLRACLKKRFFPPGDAGAEALAPNFFLKP